MENANSSCPDGNCTSGNTDLKNSDTDGDGLTDWEEKNIHNTSIYLQDTDGDGISDKKEVEQGTDPNCPQGKDCQTYNETRSKNVQTKQSFSTSSTSSVTSKPPQNSFSGLDMGTSTSQKLKQSEEAQKIMEGKGDADTLRKVLLEAGMDKKILDQINDEQLMKSYQKVMNNSN